MRARAAILLGGGVLAVGAGFLGLVRQMSKLKRWDLGPLASENRDAWSRSTRVLDGPDKQQDHNSWLLRPEGGEDSGVWVIFIHGLGSRPERTMQGIHVFEERGCTCLFIAHAAGQPAGQTTHTYGQREWTHVVDWVDYARAHGATHVVLVGWSYGALLALRAAAFLKDEALLVGLILDSPLLDWPETIAYSAQRYRLPRRVAKAAWWSLRLPAVARAAGLPFAVRIAETDLDALSGQIRLPLLAIHGTKDRTLPYLVTQRFSALRPERQFVAFPGSGHAAERYDDAGRWDACVGSWLDRTLYRDSPS